MIPPPYLRLALWLAGVFALLLLLPFSPPPAAGQQKKPAEEKRQKQNLSFEVDAHSVDPFAEGNQANGKRAFRRGETFLVTISVTPLNGYHTYPLTRRAPDQLEAQLSKLTLKDDASFRILYPIRESAPEWKDERDKDGGELYLEHDEPFHWQVEVYLEPTAPAGQTIQLPLHVWAWVCKETCAAETYDLSVPVAVSTDPAAEPSPELKKRLETKKAPPPAPEVMPVPSHLQKPVGKPPSSGKAGSPPSSPDGAAGGSKGPPTDLLGAIITAVIGGLVSLLTPCVFPMIPITVSFFLKQAEVPAVSAGAEQQAPAGGRSSGGGQSALLLACVYSATIVLVMTVGGLALMQVLVQISNHYVTNLMLAAIFVFFALSLLGWYDITLPSWMQDMTAAREGKGGYVGVFFMALTFSIISFTCVGPIYGSFITLQASSGAAYFRQAASVFAFSVAFAAPFFVLALFPSMLRSLPRAGSWMNSVKVVMGFLELAAAVKFLRAGEIALTSTSTYFTFDLSLGLYIALSVACGLYLLGLFRLPHDHGTPETIGVPRLMFSLAFLSLAMYMTPGMFKGPDGDSQRPRGEVFEWIESFLLPETDSKPTAAAAGKGAGQGSGGQQQQQLVWHSSFKEALALAQKEGKLVFVDFTGQICTNCKKNERGPFRRPEMQEAFRKFVLVKLYTDTVPPGVEQEPGADEALRLRDTEFGSSSLPLYAIVKPTGGGDYEILRKDEQGLIRDVKAFVDWMLMDQS